MDQHREELEFRRIAITTKIERSEQPIVQYREGIDHSVERSTSSTDCSGT